MLVVILYLFSIILANVITASTQPINLGYFIIPYGSFLIGFCFVFRDFVQRSFGKKKTYFFIVIALILSALTSYLLEDTLWIVTASSITFIIAECIDTEIFSRLKGSFPKKILVSGGVSGSIDSVLFVIIGLSPLGAGFLPWNLVLYAILGQLLIKVIISVLVAGFYSRGAVNGKR